MALSKISEALLGKRLDPFSGQTRLAYAAVIGKIELHQRSVVLCVPAKTGVHTETTGFGEAEGDCRDGDWPCSSERH